MAVILSVARSADGYIDDSSEARLVLSTPEDWAEVYSLRAAVDAIIIGAETLRRDNPRLGLKSEELRVGRLAEGRSAEPCRVVISRRGDIDPQLRIFEPGGGDIIIFSLIPRPELEGRAEVIVEEHITASFVVTELEKRGLTELMVEGGAQILQLFLDEGCATTLRLATNPTIMVDDSTAPLFELPQILGSLSPHRSQLGAMVVETYALRGEDHLRDREYLQRAIENSRHCSPSPTSYCVGAVVVTAAGELFDGYTHETSPTHHAEQEAIKKAEAAGVTLRGATIYSSMEPCSQRVSEPESCSAIIIRHGFARALFALYEPDCFVQCRGALNMRLAGVEVKCIKELGAQVMEVNAHLFG